ncbi:hypoxanthine-guanine phosphoribosyltransferase [Leeia sp. TBRC 13508]|uniref:Hypoxanthine-guanine phosphoribosyltransferase n=1 Tax=Leeia speluncae TaxID=2884804 RepID=A0ABS8D353_9NEIS|nr:hypoxanthine-guanine phosphoribosyltransferase [Leeia speluncae]MCB6182426.1 hypoxanthine-guanine phosphoribosyltransferase [Leeia speluncae]
MTFSIDEARQVMAEADLLHGQAEINAAIAKMGEKITEDMADSNPIVFCVMNGGLIIAGQLLTHLNFPLQYEYIHATRYGDETSGGKLLWKVPPKADLSGRNILVIDDILDEGNTLVEIVKSCQAAGAASVKVAVLIDKQHNRKADGAHADFVGLSVQDRFLFGYGMDYKGYWRNAPGIYAVKGL